MIFSLGYVQTLCSSVQLIVFLNAFDQWYHSNSLSDRDKRKHFSCLYKILDSIQQCRSAPFNTLTPHPAPVTERHHPALVPLLLWSVWQLSHVLVKLQRLLQVHHHMYDLGWCRAPLCVREGQPGVYPQSGWKYFCQITDQELWPCWGTHLDQTQWNPEGRRTDVVWQMCSFIFWKAGKQRWMRWKVFLQQWHLSVRVCYGQPDEFTTIALL